jgi:Putative beta barrel porin-7 (BBP7)
MHPKLKIIALVAIGIVVAWPAWTAAQDGTSCASCSTGCASGLPDSSEFAGPSGFCPTDWFTVPDSCPAPARFYESPRRRVYGLAEGVAFRRSASGNQDFAKINPPGLVALSTRDLNFAYQGGVRGLVGLRMNDRFALEGSYFGLLQWDESSAVRNETINSFGTPGVLVSPFTNFGVPREAGFDYNTVVSIRVESRLENAEFNLRQVLDTNPSTMQATVLYGFRYINVDEEFEYRSQSFVPPVAGTANAVDVGTNNQLFGFQVGTMLEFNVEPRCWINGEFKAGVFHNNASQSTDFVSGPLAGPPTLINTGIAREATTWMLDGSASVMYQFTPSIVARVGYQAIWLDGLALASENFSQNAPLLGLGPAILAKDGSVVYHGPFAGLTFTW